MAAPQPAPSVSCWAFAGAPATAIGPSMVHAITDPSLAIPPAFPLPAATVRQDDAAGWYGAPPWAHWTRTPSERRAMNQGLVPSGVRWNTCSSSAAAAGIFGNPAGGAVPWSNWSRSEPSVRISGTGTDP